MLSAWVDCHDKPLWRFNIAGSMTCSSCGNKQKGKGGKKAAFKSATDGYQLCRRCMEKHVVRDWQPYGEVDLRGELVAHLVGWRSTLTVVTRSGRLGTLELPVAAKSEDADPAASSTAVWLKLEKEADTGVLGAPVKKLVVAEEHRLVLTEDGQVYSRGANACGQLGLGSTASADKWSKVTFPEDTAPIKDIATSTRHSLFLTREGRLLSCGERDKVNFVLQNLYFMGIILIIHLCVWVCMFPDMPFMCAGCISNCCL